MKPSNVGKTAWLAAMLCLACAGRGEEVESDATATESEATPVSFDSPSYHRRPFVVSVAVRGEYDDNIFTSEFDPVTSYKVIAEPELGFNLTNSRSFLGLRYRHSTTYYENRPGDPFDQAHFFDVVLNHQFSRRFSIDVSERFRFAQEPELTEEATLIRRFGNYIQNSFGVGGSYYLTRRWYLNLNLSHDYWNYEDVIYSQLDREVYTAGTGINFQVSPVTVTGLFYNYTVTEFKNSPRDSDTHLVYAGLLQTFTPQWTASLQGGAQYRKAELSKADISPFASVSTTYHFLPTSSFTMGYNVSLQDTDVVNFNYSQTQHVFATVTSQLTYDLTLTTGADYILTDYPADQRLGGLGSDASETTVVYRGELTYRFTPQWFGSLGYTYTTVDSDLFGRNYDRSLASAGMRFVY